MTVRISDRALRNLAEVYDHIAADNAEAAARVAGRILQAINRLGQMPRWGRESQLRRRRELVVDQYVVVYSIRRGEVVVETITHGARRR